MPDNGVNTVIKVWKYNRLSSTEPTGNDCQLSQILQSTATTAECRYTAMTQEETWHQLMNMTECNVMSSATHVTNVIYMCEKTNKCIQWQHVTRCVQQWLCSGVWVDINIHCTWHWPLPLPLPASNICGPLALGYCPYQGQGPRWGWGVSRSQVQLSGTVCQPPCEPQLSPPWRSLNIRRSHLFSWSTARPRTI